MCWLFGCVQIKSKVLKNVVMEFSSECAVNVWSSGKRDWPLLWPSASVTSSHRSSLCSLIKIQRKTQQSHINTHICTRVLHTHTQSLILIGWPKATDIICYGVRPQSHSERPAASAVTPPPKKTGGASEGGRVKKRQIEDKLAREGRRRGGRTQQQQQQQRQKHKVAPSSLIRISNWTNSRWQRCACQIRSCPGRVRQREEREGGTLLRAQYHS